MSNLRATEIICKVDNGDISPISDARSETDPFSQIDGFPESANRTRIRADSQIFRLLLASYFCDSGIEKFAPICKQWIIA